MEWTIQEVARSAGTTSRALRHYDAIGLLHPIRAASGGQRIYDSAGLLRLQRILLLRGLGVGLPRIARILDETAAADEADALAEHATALREERERLTRQITAVEKTIAALRGGEELMMDTMFEGFDHTAYRDEVETRWGAEAYSRSDAWWRGMSADDRSAWQQRAADLARDWIRAAESGVAADSPIALGMARRHVEWLAGMPGTPSGADMRAYVTGLADMYVADPRFGANYATADGGTAGAEFVRDALHTYVAREL
jgi:DNA-binding transcriptional MerR regulator